MTLLLALLRPLLQLQSHVAGADFLKVGKEQTSLITIETPPQRPTSHNPAVRRGSHDSTHHPKSHTFLGRVFPLECLVTCENLTTHSYITSAKEETPRKGRGCSELHQKLHSSPWDTEVQ